MTIDFFRQLTALGSCSFFCLWAQPGEAHRVSETRLQKELHRHASATIVLQKFCTEISPHAKLRSILLDLREKSPPPDLSKRLHLRAEQAIRVRHVSLRCGNIPFSEAWNWYVPSRLTVKMNHILTTQQVPFGRVIEPLGFRRRRLASFKPAVPGTYVLQDKAVVVRRSDSVPLAYVEENYLTSAFAPFQ